MPLKMMFMNKPKAVFFFELWFFTLLLFYFLDSACSCKLKDFTLTWLSMKWAS